MIGVDVHKQSVTAVAVDEAGRMLDGANGALGSEELIGWAEALAASGCGRWRIAGCDAVA